MRHLFRFLLVFVLVGIGPLCGNSQESEKSQPKFQKQFSVLMEVGPMVPRDIDWANQIRENFDYRALDFRLGFKSTKPDVYNVVYRYPSFGIGYYVATFNNVYIGKPNAIYAFADIPIRKTFLENRLRFGYYTAFGVAFNFKPFDPDDNPVNQFIGSYENSYVHIGFNMRYALSPNLDLEGLIGLKHFSNGSLRKPNSGVNIIPFSFGVRTNLNRAEFPKVEFESFPEFIPNTQVNIWTSVGGKNYEIGGGQYLKWGLGFNHLWQNKYRYRYGVGLDWFVSGAVESRLGIDEASFWDRNSFAVVGSWEWVLKPNLYVPIGLGVYMHRKRFNDELSFYYQRIGVRYRFNNQMFAGVTIKAHGFKADFFEWTLGYTLFKDQNKY